MKFQPIIMTSMKFVLTVMGLMVLSLAASAEQNCDILGKAMSNAIKYRDHPNILYTIINSGTMYDMCTSMPAKDWETLAEKSGYDIMNKPEDVRTLACKMTGAKSKQELSEIFGMTLAQVNKFLVAVSCPLKHVKGISELREIAYMAGRILEWVDYSDFPPVTAGAKVYEATTYALYSFTNEQFKKPYIRSVFEGAPFPLTKSPEYVIDALKTSTTIEEMAKRFGMSVRMLKSLREPKIRKIALDTEKSIFVPFRFFEAVDSVGLLNLK